MAEVISSLFHEHWYLARYSDVAAAAGRGETTAQRHFELHGKAEGRSPGPLFDTAYYLRSNPDVAAAVLRGEITAYDHFLQHGMQEGRSPLAILDIPFYLAQNPDVAAAVAAGGISAIQHLLTYGLDEGRQVFPFLNLHDYLEANPDVAQAVATGETDPLSHLLAYGIAEGRLLSNGVDLQFFAYDPVFNAAIAAGRLEGALTRVAEVTPFLPHFVPPAGWHPAPDTPIPQGFVIPPGGDYLVVPDGVIVPPDTQLPDAFGPHPGPQPHPDDGPPSIHHVLTPAIDTLNGDSGNDLFEAPAGVPDTLNTGDQLDGRGGYDTLTIAAGGYVNGAAPTLHNIEVINNSNLGSVPVALNLANTSGVRELWSNSNGTRGTDPIPTAKYLNAALDTVFGVRNLADEGWAAIDVGFADALSGSHDTLKLKLAGANTSQSLVNLSWNNGVNTGVETVEIDAQAGLTRHGVNFAANATMEKVVVKGDGHVTVTSLGACDTPNDPAFNQLTHFDALAARGNIIARLEHAPMLASAILGAGADQLYINASRLDGIGKTFNGGTGEDSLIVELSDPAELGALKFNGVTNFEHLMLVHTGEFDISSSTILDVSVPDFESLTLALGDPLELDNALTIKGSASLKSLNIMSDFISCGCDPLTLDGFTTLEINIDAVFVADLQLTASLKSLTLNVIDDKSLRTF